MVLPLRMLLISLLAAIQLSPSSAQSSVASTLSICAPDIDKLTMNLYGCPITHATTMIDCLKEHIDDISDPACLDAVNTYVSQHSGLELGDLQACSADVDIPTQTLYGCSITNLPALSACLQTKTEQITDNDCLAALGTYIADHDSEGTHRPVETDDEKNAEDQICDAKLATVCQKQFYVAAFTQVLEPLKRCAIRHINETGRTCVAMLQNASSDGLLTHMRLCVAKTVEFCPSQTAMVATQLALGIKSLQGPALVALVACLRNHTAEMKQGCSGFFESVSDVVRQIGDRASNQFHDDENTIPGVPTPTQPPKPPSSAQTPAPHVPTSGKNHGESGQTGDASGAGTSDDGNSGLSGGAIAGIVVSCVLVVGFAVAGVFFWRKRVAYANLNSMMGLAQGNALPQMEVGFEAGGKSDYEKVMMA